MLLDRRESRYPAARASAVSFLVFDMLLAHSRVLMAVSTVLR